MADSPEDVITTVLCENYGGLLKSGWSVRPPGTVEGSLHRAGAVASDMADLICSVLRHEGLLGE